MNQNKKWLIGGIATVTILGILFAWPKISQEEPVLNDSDQKKAERIQAAGLECIDGHISLVSHIHPEVEIYVDEERRLIPADIGITPTCMAEIHTHDTSGQLHIETAKPGKQFNLQSFFNVWGEPLEKDGYELKATVNGKSVTGVANLTLKDKDKIVLRYLKKN